MVLLIILIVVLCRRRQRNKSKFKTFSGLEKRSDSGVRLFELICCGLAHGDIHAIWVVVMSSWLQITIDHQYMMASPTCYCVYKTITLVLYFHGDIHAIWVVAMSSWLQITIDHQYMMASPTCYCVYKTITLVLYFQSKISISDYI